MKKTLSAIFGVLVLSISVKAQNQASQYQVDYRLDRNTANSFYGIAILYTDREEIASQTERISSSFTATRLSNISRKFAFRYGISVLDKGYREDLLVITFADGNFERSQQNIQMIYLGTPVILGFNLNNNNRLISGFAEAGIQPEILLHQIRSNYMNFNLNKFGMSYIIGAGIKVQILDRYSVLLNPRVNLAAIRYDENRQDNPFQIVNYKPSSTGITVGFQF